MKFNFVKNTKTMGIRVSPKNFDRIEALAKKHRVSKCCIATELVKVALNEVKL